MKHARTIICVNISLKFQSTLKIELLIIKKVKKVIIRWIKSCVQSGCDKLGVNSLSFTQWKQAVISATDEKISHVSAKVTLEKKPKNMLKLKDEAIAEE